MKKTIQAVIMGCFFYANSAAALYTCSGYAEGVSIDPKSGVVLVQRVGTLEWPKLCSVNGNYNGISADACRTVFSTLLTAQAAHKKVSFWFNDGRDCSKESHAPWQTLTGWYFGPQLID